MIIIKECNTNLTETRSNRPEGGCGDSLFIKTKIMCFKNVTAPTNRVKKIITYFLIVHPRGTHAEISTTTMKIGGENKT